jgi:hypothetical protein
MLVHATQATDRERFAVREAESARIVRGDGLLPIHGFVHGGIIAHNPARLRVAGRASPPKGANPHARRPTGATESRDRKREVEPSALVSGRRLFLHSRCPRNVDSQRDR